MPKFSTRTSITTGVVLVISWAAGSAYAGDDPYAPPANYYSTAVGVGSVLADNLHDIIDNHVVRSYGDARDSLQLLDQDPADPDDVILIYSGIAVLGQWDAGVTWNREHQWPRSWGIDSSGPDNSDQFNLRPANPSVNSSRGNKPFGIGSGYWDPQALALPGVNDRGDCSRACFYMAVRYDGSDSSTEDLQLVSGMPGPNQMGDLTRMLEWHYSDAVDDIERRRNHLVYSSADNPQHYQGNRNPFIDHPEFVWAIWGPVDNDTTLFVGAIPESDGGSVWTEVVRFIAGAQAPPEIVVTLNKSGSTPTTYDAVPFGDVLCNGCGQGRAFVSGVQDAELELTVPSTATPVAYSGVVLIDNTDLTSDGPAQGVDDADDMIMLDVLALDYSDGSFSPIQNLDELTIDFGIVFGGGGPAQLGFDIYNLETTSGLTAGLQLLSISGSGDTAEMLTDVTPFENLAGGSGMAFTATFDHGGVVGDFEAVYTFSVADEAIPGSSVGDDLTLTLVGTVTEGGCLAAADCADLDNDGIRDDGCLYSACSGGQCLGTAIVFADMGGQFGACLPDGTADGNDRFHALNCFADVDAGQIPGYSCEDDPPVAMNVDSGGPFGDCAPDGVCDGNDAFAALNAFAGTTSCTCPLDGGPMPTVDADAGEVTQAALGLRSSAGDVRPGALFEVDVFLAEPVADLRGYQLHLEASGGSNGHLVLEDISIHERKDWAYHQRGAWSAFNVFTGQMVAGLDSAGIPAPAGAYLATFTYRASRRAAGDFVIDVLDSVDDPSHRTYLFATASTARIELDPAPALPLRIGAVKMRAR